MTDLTSSLDKYADDLNKIFKPLGVTAVVEDRDSCYYLILDGTKLYPTAPEWKNNIGKTFNDFVGVFIPNLFHKMECNIISDTKVEFVIGNVFDMLARTAGKE